MMPDLSAAILVGGASRRMGADKALLMLDGQTLLERAIGSVAAVANEVTIVGDRLPYHAFGVPVVSDLYPGTGALGGIATALRHARHDHILIVACDMPFLSIDLLRAMADEERTYDVLLPVSDASPSHQGGEHTYETLHAIYHRRCLLPIERQLERGDRKVVAALTGMNIRELSASWLRRYDPVLDSFVNANRPEEWAAVQARTANETLTVEDVK